MCLNLGHRDSPVAGFRRLALEMTVPPPVNTHHCKVPESALIFKRCTARPAAEPADAESSAPAEIRQLRRNETEPILEMNFNLRFFDLSHHDVPQKVEEQTLNQILQERSGKLEDVLKRPC
jgi:hypothetical protein